MSDFATINDIISLFRPLSAEETERATALLPVVSDSLRQEAILVGKDLDAMVAESPTLSTVANRFALMLSLALL